MISLRELIKALKDPETGARHMHVTPRGGLYMDPKVVTSSNKYKELAKRAKNSFRDTNL